MGAILDIPELHRLSVADQVVGVLRERIHRGELRPGTPLLEVPLASSLGVSRNTVREAMKVLSLEGLLTRSAHRAATVAELTPQDIREIYQLRRMLEFSAVQAAKHARGEHLKKLRSLVDQYEAAARAGDWSSAVASDLQFHSLLIRFHHNRRLESFYRMVLDELRMGMVLLDRSLDDPTRLIRVHRRIYQSLAAGRLRQCAASLARHLDESEAKIIKIVSDHPAQRNSKPGSGGLARTRFRIPRKTSGKQAR